MSQIKSQIFSMCLMAGVLAALAPGASHADNIQMLPPKMQGTATDCHQNGGLLAMIDSGENGTSAINCVTNATMDASGNLATPGSVTTLGNVTASTGQVTANKFYSYSDAFVGGSETINNALSVTNGATIGGVLGIGTASPQAPLHVFAPEADSASSPNYGKGLLIENHSTNYNSPRLYMVDTSVAPGTVTTSPAWGIDNWADRFRIWRQPNINTAGIEYFTVTNSGNVGIGTANPKTKLEVDGTILLGTPVGSPASTNAPAYIIGENKYDNTPGDGWTLSVSPRLGDSSSPSPSVLLGEVGGVAAIGASDIADANGNGVAQNLVLQPPGAGNVGIGTTTPSGTLDIENGSKSAQLCLNGNCISSFASLQGAAGTAGTKGAKGEKGDPGVGVSSASLSGTDLVLSFSNGTTQDVGNVQGPQGTQGPKGDKGDPGAAVSAMAIVGGVYTVNLDGSCRHANPYTNGCGCPSGQNAMTIFDFDNSTCANGYFSDGWRTSGCGIISYLCLAQ